MTLSTYYELNCGQPVMHKDGRPIQKPLDSISIAFAVDKESGRITLHKHGETSAVHNWINVAKARLLASGDLGITMADEIGVIDFNAFPPGNIPVDMINDALAGNQMQLARLVQPEKTIDVPVREINRA